MKELRVQAPVIFAHLNPLTLLFCRSFDSYCYVRARTLDGDKCLSGIGYCNYYRWVEINTLYFFKRQQSAKTFDDLSQELSSWKKDSLSWLVLMRLVSLLHLALKAFIFAFGEQINKSDMII